MLSLFGKGVLINTCLIEFDNLSRVDFLNIILNFPDNVFNLSFVTLLDLEKT